MKDYDLKSLKAASLVKGYFLNETFPELVRQSLDHLCDEIEQIIGDCNQILEQRAQRDEIDRVRKAAEREAKKAKPDHIAGVEKKLNDTGHFKTLAHIITADKGSKEFHCSICGSGHCELMDEQDEFCKICGGTCDPDNHIIPQNAASNEVEKTDTKPEKKKREWTPEQRAAQGERIKATQAKMKLQHEQNRSAKTVVQSHVEKTSPYIGKRLDGNLTEADFGDIRERIGKGDGMRAIADDYDVSVEALHTWYDAVLARVKV